MAAKRMAILDTVLHKEPRAGDMASRIQLSGIGAIKSELGVQARE